MASPLKGLVGGIDESGRGCLVGDLVVAGVAVARARVPELKGLGVRDSKLLSRKRRESLFGEILKVSARACATRIPPREIDEVVISGMRYRKLNYLEAVYFAKVADQLGASHVTVDASDTSPERFRSAMADSMTCRCRIAAFHKADRDFPVVSAASIIAKVMRDRAVEELRAEFGDFGSGYPSDRRTRDFFTEMMRTGADLPAFVRRSWKTLERLEQALLAPL
jgi:ribonuclease HII